ncbi:MAG: DUF1501 domain-containing protein [Armatimonadetes bacterium]|nr:DUF1501 domain-containing protein [Armatimonadota bacterium]
MNFDFLNSEAITRRTFLRDVSYGIGSLALSHVLGNSILSSPIVKKIAPKAKQVVFLFMAGAPSQLDMFDYKPELNKRNGEECPEELTQGERFAFIKGRPKLLASPHQFQQVGESGLWVSNLLPHFRDIADDVVMIRSMQTDQFNHAPAQIFMNSGFQIPGRPSFGAWMSYGLGTENENLPAFVVLVSGDNNPDGGKACWGSGFLPSQHQGVEFRSNGEPILFITNPDGVTEELRRDSLDVLGDLNRMRHGEVLDPEIEARIAQYELAFRMQTSVPELVDIESEPDEVHALYGTEPGKRSFANNCLLARRLVERGVRFVQLYHRGWDNHGESEGNDLKNGLGRMCKQTDQPAAALVKDLKRRGLLDETLVIWGGEFGRTPMNEGRGGSPYQGRDHHPRAFTMWLAGGGIRAGTAYGMTDDFGYNVVENPVHVHDLHATILHLLGVNHTELTYQFQGRDFRLTDVHGKVIEGLIH